MLEHFLFKGSDLAGTARTFGTAGGVERTSNVTGTAVDCGEVRPFFDRDLEIARHPHR